MAKPYSPHDWYWFVAGDETRVYSSANGEYLAVADPTFTQWASDGTAPTRISSETELGEVLAAYSLRPVAANVLDGYQDTQSRQLTIQVVAKVLLWCVNEIRTLKGQSTISAAQFRAFVKGLM
ncbi:MAG: hypothetical protein EOO12_00155 [Chitinophagaceae bacterium]|nr:MAG: hypothetical protein EOO12_00155 [Chitinophagaceae bacterium]